MAGPVVAPDSAPQTDNAPLGRVVFVAAAAALGGFLFGYDSAVINGAIIGIETHFNVGSSETGTVVAVALLGAAAGALAAGRLADHFGRIRIMQLAAILFAASSVGAALPHSLWMLGFWRVLAGISIGIASVIGPTYIAEVAPARYRGGLASLQQMGIVLGITASQLANWAIAQGADGKSENDFGPLQAWQWMLMAAAVPAVIYFVLASMIPESPRWLISVGRVDQARVVVRDLEGDVDIDDRITTLQSELQTDHKPRLRDIRGGPFLLMPIVWVGIGLAIFQQLVGINVIFYYSSILWRSVGIDQSSSLLISLSTSIVNIIGTVIAIVFIDRIGRKPLALIGSVGMAISLGLAAWAFSHKSGSGNSISIPHDYGMLALISAHGFVFFFAVSWGVILWVMIGEMFPLKARAMAISVATMFNWIANWAVTETFPSLSDWNLSGTYWIYTAFAVLSFFFISIFVRETKGRELGDMK